MSQPSCVFGNQDGSASEFKTFSGASKTFGPRTLEVHKNPCDKSLVVTDAGNTEPILIVKSCNTRTHCRREVVEVLDRKENPVFMLQKQNATLHARCDGYSPGDDKKNHGDKLFTVKKHDILQNHTNLNVKLHDAFLDKFATLEMEKHRALLTDLLNKGFSLENDTLEKGASLEKEKDNCKIIGNWSDKKFTINKPGSSTAIAEVHPLYTNDKFKVVVSDNVNCAFVISLIAAVDCMKDPGILKTAGKAVGVVMKAAAGAALTAVAQEGVGLFFS